MDDFMKNAVTTPTIIVLDASSSSNNKTVAGSIISSLREDETLEPQMPLDCKSADVAGNVKEQQRQQPPKLNLQKVALTGRRKEYALLKASYKRIQNGKHPSELVLIDGLSGTGKSKLATSIREPVTLKRHGFFVSGKFDVQQREPYSALIEAFTDLCDLLEHDKDIHKDISKALNGDISILSKVIPNLHRVVAGALSLKDENERQSDYSSPQDQGNFTQLKLACRKFLSAVASRKHPVVLLIDDLQWADEPSTEILRSIVTDESSKYILIIGTYRSNFYGDDVLYSPLQDFLDNIKQNKECLQCTNIHLDDLDSRQVASLIAKCVHASSSSNDNVVSLAALVVKRTGGNPFYVIQFLDMLQHHGIFEYHENTGWDWSVEQIQAETTATENVVEILEGRIGKLDVDTQAVLRLAACVGFAFDKGVVRMAYLRQQQNAWKTKQMNEAAFSDKVDQALEIAEDIGLVETTTSGLYRFCHDSISDCLYSMTPPGPKLASVHLILGRVMQEMCENDKARASDFTYAIADQLNRARTLIMSDMERLDCAQCNLCAVQLSMSQCAFVLAAEYARSGLDMIANIPNKWDEEGPVYSTVVDLHCVAAHSMYCTGCIEESDYNLQQVLNNTESLVDQTRARKIQVYSLGAQARFEEAINVAFDAARALGVKIPKRPTMRHAIWRIIKTKSLLQSKSDEELLETGTVRYEDVKSVCDLLGIASHCSSLTMSIPHLVVTITTLLRLSVKWKLLIAMPYCLFGMLETSMNNIPGAIRMGELTLKMHELQNVNIPRYGDICVMHTFLFHWRAPSRDSLDKFYESYTAGMEAGVVDVAFLASANWMQLALVCGYPLPQLEQHMRYFCKQMDDFDHTSQKYTSFPYWQVCLNLLGQTEEPILLTGEAMDEATYLQEAHMVAVAPPTLNWARIFLAYHFDDLPKLKMLIRECETFGSIGVGHFNVYISKFYFGISYIKLYRRFRRRPDKRKAYKIANVLGKWSKDGCPNTRPLFAIMRAELATLERKSSREHIQGLFLDAIREANVMQNDMWEAMAHECAASHYDDLNITPGVPEDNQARCSLDQAIGLYTRYGAYAKVEFLEKNKMTRPKAIVTE